MKEFSEAQIKKYLLTAVEDENNVKESDKEDWRWSPRAQYSIHFPDLFFRLYTPYAPNPTSTTPRSTIVAGSGTITKIMDILHPVRY
jgi:hypothetical protein